MTKNKCEERLKELQSEYETGQKMLADLDSKRQKLNETLLRIEGAMQVLHELVKDEQPEQANGKGAAEKAAGSQGLPLS